MCKELQERNSEENINLKFNAFCENAKKENFNNLIEQGYIAAQMNSIKKLGKMLPKSVAESIAIQFWNDYKEAGLLDILNRIR